MNNTNPIDFVIIWVDGNDPVWIKEKDRYVEQTRRERNDEFFDKWCDNPIRYRDWDNLQYWFRSVEFFTPWVRKVHFVTWGHLPKWLNIKNPKLNVVNHQDFIPNEYLPVFQANPIEDNLHRIKGIAEQFVFFNDDMFIIRPMRHTDFFSHGLPRDCAILDLPATKRYVTPGQNVSAEIINDHFDKNTIIKRNIWKWFHPCYGRNLMKTLLLLPWEHFGCFLQPHLPASMLKSTYEELWKIEKDALEITCREKFRGRNQVTQYLFSDWQRVTGQFRPRSPKIGRTFYLGLETSGKEPNIQEIINTITRQTCAMVCLNDGYMTDEEFEYRKKRIKGAFEQILPNKSSFEN